MSLPRKMHNIRMVADRILYYISQTYTVQATNDPPDNLESWDALETLLSYYMTRGWTMT